MFILVHTASFGGHLDIVKYLIDHNADLTIQEIEYILSNIFFVFVLSNTNHKRLWKFHSNTH